MIVLVVDDEADARDTLRDVLEEEGYTVRVAGSGADALASIEQVRPDVVLLDLMMPSTSGNEVYDHLQRTAMSASIPVVAVTADPGRAPVGVPTLEKPIRLDRMLKLVALCCKTDGAE